jgi:hypothetical protein
LRQPPLEKPARGPAVHRLVSAAGTPPAAAADAEALGRTEDAARLKQAVDEIDKGDAVATRLAEAVERAAA